MGYSTPASRSMTPASTAISSHSGTGQTAQLQEENERLRAQLEVTQWERDNALGHAIMLRVEYNSLKKKLNAKEERAKRKGCSIRQHGLMTSAESRQRIAEEDARKAAKKQQTEAAQSRRREKEAAVQVRRDAMALRFTEAVSTRKQRQNLRPLP